MVRSGKRVNTPESSQSTNEKHEFANVIVEPTAAGASFDVEGIFDEEPKCMLIVVPVSAQAAKNGSQYRSLSWIDGSPSRGGSSEKQTACTPRSALRRISAAASCGSHNGMMISGISRPSEGPHHSSTIQSLYAWTHSSPSSLSLASENVGPQKRGKLGKHRD